MKLVGDIGGTNARFALVEHGSTDPLHVQVLPCADFASFADALAAYLASRSPVTIKQAAIAVGMPVVDDWLTMTNNNWSFSQQEVKKTFDLDQLLITNDFSALALSVPLLDECDLVTVGRGKFAARETIGVIGPGTGLGVSGLVCGHDGRWSALQGEGGHVSLAPQTARQQKVVDHLLAQYGRVSAERFLSGPGLSSIYDALIHIDGVAGAVDTAKALQAADITAGAMAGSDEHCAEAVSIFCSQLGAVAGDLALTLGAEGGIYIGGGIVPRLGEYFTNSEFRASFEDKGRMSSYLSSIGTRVIVAEYPALRGVATLLR